MSRWLLPVLLLSAMSLSGCLPAGSVAPIPRAPPASGASGAAISGGAISGTATPGATTSGATIGPAQAQLVQEVAAATGKDPAALNALLDGAVVKPGILDAISRPAEARPWSTYRPLFVNPARIAQGIGYLKRHRALLDEIAAQYGVPPQYLVAIVGVETSYGANTGSYRVLDALVTLAFHYPPRAQYFRGELKALLELPADKLPGPIPEIYGSYAGAQGLAQFMPSSIRDFAVDADGEGHINLMASLPDAFASIANYFRAHGWRPGQPVAIQADPSASATAPPAYDPAPPVKPLARFTAAGYAPTAQANPALPASLLTLAGANGPEYWLTFNNFYVITRYNRSPMYAMAVMQLADAIARGIDATPPAR